MTMGRIISGSRPTPLLMGRVWFNSNRVFSGFEFIFLKSETSSGRVQVLLLLPYLNYILKIFFYYFILYFNINNNN